MTAAAGNAVTIKPGSGGTPNKAGAPWNTDMSPGENRWRILKISGTYNPTSAEGTLSILDDQANTIWQADGNTFAEDFGAVWGLQVPRAQAATAPGTFAVTLLNIGGAVAKLNVIFFLEQ